MIAKTVSTLAFSTGLKAAAVAVSWPLSPKQLLLAALVTTGVIARELVLSQFALAQKVKHAIEGCGSC